MRHLIEQIREAIPLGLTNEAICGDSCEGCSSKLLIYLETELDDWEHRLREGYEPTLGDLDRLARQGHKIRQVLQQNGVIDQTD
jgi:hypothetical protein